MINTLQINSKKEIPDEIEYTEEDILKGLKKITKKIELQLMKQEDFMNPRTQTLVRIYFSSIREIRNSMSIISAKNFRKMKEAQLKKEEKTNGSENCTNHTPETLNTNINSNEKPSNPQKQNSVYLW